MSEQPLSELLLKIKAEFHKKSIGIITSNIILQEAIIQDVKQAIQEALKELKEKVKNTPIKTEDIVNNKIIIADYIYWKDFREILDTTFKKHFGGLVE